MIFGKNWLRRKNSSLVDNETVNDPRGIYYTEKALAADGKVAFLFPGQGAQYVNMLADLAIYFPEVRAVFDRSDHLLFETLLKPLSTQIFPPSAFTKEEETSQLKALSQTRIAQPSIGTASLAMQTLLRLLGIEPDMTAGHSYGEFVALCSAGVLSEEDLVTISEARGRFMTEAVGAEPGTMAAVKAHVDKVYKHIKGKDGVWIANINAPEQTVITGTQVAIEETVEELKNDGIKAIPLAVSCAMHSPIVAPAAQRLNDFLANISLSEPEIKVFSNTTGKAYPTDPEAIVSQLAKHLVSKVKFIDEIEEMYREGARIFVEVGPGRVLSGLASRILGDREHLSIFTNQPGRNGLMQLQHAVGQLIVNGVNVSLDRFFEGRSLKDADLPFLIKESQKEELNPTMWLLNGGRSVSARDITADRSDFVVKPIDISKPAKQVNQPVVGEAKREEAPAVAPPLNEQIPAPEVPVGEEPALSYDQCSSEEQYYSEEAFLQSGDDMDQAMIYYQRLMARFLDTQKSIMMTYLQGQGTAPSASPIPKDVQKSTYSPARPAVAADLGVISNPEQRQATTPPVPQQETVSPPAVAEPPVVAEAPPIAAAPPAASVVISKDEIQERLLNVASEQTGYPVDMLALDADMEAELGIDSIKRVEILGAFAQSFPEEVQVLFEPLADDLSKLKDLKTIIAETATALAGVGAGTTFGQEPAAPVVAEPSAVAEAPPIAAAPRRHRL